MEITDQVLLFIIMGLLGFILVELYTLRTMAKVWANLVLDAKARGDIQWLRRIGTVLELIGIEKRKRARTRPKNLRKIPSNGRRRFLFLAVAFAAYTALTAIRIAVYLVVAAIALFLPEQRDNLGLVRFELSEQSRRWLGAGF